MWVQHFYNSPCIGLPHKMTIKFITLRNTGGSIAAGLPKTKLRLDDRHTVWQHWKLGGSVCQLVIPWHLKPHIAVCQFLLKTIFHNCSGKMNGKNNLLLRILVWAALVERASCGERGIIEFTPQSRYEIACPFSAHRSVWAPPVLSSVQEGMIR